MVLDEEALEAMLARGRAAEGKTERPRMELADASDHFEVYERKEPRPEATPGPEPEPPAPTPAASLPAADDFEVFEKTPSNDMPDFVEHAPEPAPEPPVPEPTPTPQPQLVPEPVAHAPLAQPETRHEPTPQPRRRPEVWPPIRRSHAPAAAPPTRPTQPTQNTPVPAEPAPQVKPAGTGGARIAILQSTFNEELTGAMAKLAKDTATQRGATVTTHATVPGVYDMPLVAKHLLARDDVDALVVLGVVVKGETQHDELITFATAKTLQEVSLAADKPIGLGITGPGMTWEQAEARVGNAVHAVDAALVLLRV